MGSKFLQPQGGVSLTNGTANLNIRTEVVQSLSPSLPVHSTAGRQLVSGLIELADCDFIPITTPYAGTLSVQDLITQNNTVPINLNTYLGTNTTNVAALQAATQYITAGAGTTTIASTNVDVVGTNFLWNGVQVATTGGLGAYLPLAGGTMSGNIAMGTDNITSVGTLGFASGVQIGAGTATTDNTQVAIGLNATTNAGNGVAIGHDCTGSSNSVAIGVSATTVGDGGAVAVGPAASVSGNYAVALGAGASATGAYSIAIGASSSGVYAGFAAPLGSGATAGAANGIAIGSGASVSAINAIAIGNGASNPNASTCLIGDPSITDISASSGSCDLGDSQAFNVLNIVQIQPAGDILIGSHQTLGSTSDSILVGDYASNVSNTGISVGIGQSCVVAGLDGVAVGNGAQAGASGDYAIGIGSAVRASATNSIAIGQGTTNAVAHTAVIGDAAIVDISPFSFGICNLGNANPFLNVNLAGAIIPQADILIGAGTVDSAALAGGIVIGNLATILGSTGAPVALGVSSSSTGAASVAIGSNAVSSSMQSVSIGHAASASNTHAIAVGLSAVASGANSIAIGDGAQGTATTAIAIGLAAHNSVASTVLLGDTAVDDIYPNSTVCDLGANRAFLNAYLSGACFVQTGNPATYVIFAQPGQTSITGTTETSLTATSDHPNVGTLTFAANTINTGMQWVFTSQIFVNVALGTCTFYVRLNGTDYVSVAFTGPVNAYGTLTVNFSNRAGVDVDTTMMILLNGTLPAAAFARQALNPAVSNAFDFTVLMSNTTYNVDSSGGTMSVSGQT